MSRKREVDSPGGRETGVEAQGGAWPRYPRANVPGVKSCSLRRRVSRCFRPPPPDAHVAPAAGSYRITLLPSRVENPTYPSRPGTRTRNRAVVRSSASTAQVDDPGRGHTKLIGASKGPGNALERRTRGDARFRTALTPGWVGVRGTASRRERPPMVHMVVDCRRAEPAWPRMPARRLSVIGRPVPLRT